MSEWFKEPVLKTGDSQEPWVRIPLSPPHFFSKRNLTGMSFGMQKYPSGRRGSPAKGVVWETAARVQIPPSAPNPGTLYCKASGVFLTLARDSSVTDDTGQAGQRAAGILFEKKICRWNELTPLG